MNQLCPLILDDSLIGWLEVWLEVNNETVSVCIHCAPLLLIYCGQGKE